ncbi:MAG TPA: YcnI family protein [Acidimicrobiia bacterium]|jgi:uncharacterized protein YcnI
MTSRRAIAGALLAIGVGAGVLSTALPAGAHVTVEPDSVANGADDAVLHFIVPNESGSANTISLAVQFPTQDPIAEVSPEPTPGWKVTTTTTKLAKPVKTDDGTFTSVISQIKWSAGSIPPDQFGEFDVLAQGFPSDAKPIAFPAIQTYSDGTIVRWIEHTSAATPDPEHPAPVVTLTNASSSQGSTAAPPTTAASDPSGQAAAAVTPTSKSSSNGLAYLAIVIGCFAAGVGLLALWFGRLGRDEIPADN